MRSTPAMCQLDVTTPENRGGWDETKATIADVRLFTSPPGELREGDSPLSQPTSQPAKGQMSDDAGVDLLGIPITHRFVSAHPRSVIQSTDPHISRQCRPAKHQVSPA